ncbi:acetate--CoA ligase family protein, partial [Candidatus Aerophobetes bacterium]|nr:acetate--CoA ligase family protein [Candidatus Aerophobetes bacterium]
ASSHTGALSGEDEAFEVAFKEAGIIRAKTVAEAFEMARGFSSGKLPKGEKVLLVTNAGGAGIMATDACEDYSIKLTSLSENTVARLKERLPEASSISNPLDILGDAEPERFEFTLKEVLSDTNVDVVVVILTPQITTRPAEVALKLKEISENSQKPILCCFMGGEIVDPAISILNKAKIPNYKDPDAMARVLRGMINYTARLRQKEEEKAEKIKVEKHRAEKILLSEKNKGNFYIGGLKALEIMKAYRIPVVESYLARTVEEALELTHKMKEPFVLKIESAEIVHKSDVGGVKVGVRKDQVENAFSEIMEKARKVVKDREKIEGILVQPLIKWGREMLIGAIQDSTFGHLIRFGLGGKYVELFRDFSTRLVPLSREKAKKMIEETKIASKFLQGFRDEPAADAEIVIDCLLRLSQLVLDFPWIQEIEANPLVVWEKGGVVIDARIKIS